MKQVFILAICSVWMFSCNEAAETKTDSVVVDTPEVDTVIPKSTDTVAKMVDTAAIDPVHKAAYKIQFTRSYCGGARPSEEMLAEYRTPQLLTHSVLKFKNHFTGKEYFLRTGADGTASADMEEGKYDVFFTKDINTNLPTGFDPECKMWQSQQLITIKVSAAGKTQDVTVHFVCNPCDENLKRRP